MSRIKFIDKYPGQVLRALSWKEPFASLMLRGKVETRVWDSKYFGWVLICASKAHYSPSQIKAISGKEQYERIEKFQQEKNWLFPCGKAIAVGKLHHSELMDNLMINPPKSPEDHKKNVEVNNAIAWATYVEPRSGLYMHHYMDVQPIAPFDWQGKLGWSTVSEEVKSKIILL